VELLTRRGDLPAAFAEVERLLAENRAGDGDVALRARLLLAKAHLYDVAGRPARGFSLAMRAAGLARRARVLPLLWQAVGSVANVLTGLGEFAAAASLLRPAIPRCIECGAWFMVAQLCSWLADAHVGRAGAEPSGSAARALAMAAAATALRDAFDYYARVGDVGKQCETRAKQAALARALGDDDMVESFSAHYLRLKAAKPASATNWQGSGAEVT